MDFITVNLASDPEPDDVPVTRENVSVPAEAVPVPVAARIAPGALKTLSTAIVRSLVVLAPPRSLPRIVIVSEVTYPEPAAVLVTV